MIAASTGAPPISTPVCSSFTASARSRSTPAPGDEVRRVFYVDGYGRDMVAISFVRTAGRDPMLQVHFPRREGEQAAELATAPVSAATWRRAVSRSVHFDRELAPVAAGSGEISICLHGWVYTAEAVDRPQAPRGEPKTRRKVQNACQDGLVYPFANEMADLALEQLPHCGALDPEQHRNNVAILNACRLLEGDRMTAAQGLNVVSRLRSIDREDRAALNLVFDYRAVLDFAGQHLGGGGGSAADAWLQQASGSGVSHFYVSRVVGERSDRVRAEGRVVRYVDQPGGESQRLEAPATLVLGTGSGATLAVERATVGAFKTAAR